MVLTQKAAREGFWRKNRFDLNEDCSPQTIICRARATDRRNVTSLRYRVDAVQNVVYHEVFRMCGSARGFFFIVTSTVLFAAACRLNGSCFVGVSIIEEIDKLRNGN